MTAIHSSIRSIIAFFAALMLLLSGTEVWADSIKGGVLAKHGEESIDDSMTYETGRRTSADLSSLSLEEAIIYSVTNELIVDISAFSIVPEDLYEIFFELDNTGQLPWYAYTCRVYSSSLTETVTEFVPINLNNDVYDRIRYEQKIAEIIATTVMDGMSSWQKALSVHDYIVANSSYDDTLEKHESYDLIVKGTAVCEGYAEAYMDIMNRVGIPCIMVISEDMNHAWNLVQLDGSWYHVDCTWDDPTPDMNGYVRHSYFLLTDDEISSDDKAVDRETDGSTESVGTHYGWATDIKCTDASYTNGFWRGINSMICYYDDCTSYFRLDENWEISIYKRDEVTGDVQQIYYHEPMYLDIGYGRYAYPVLGLSYWNDRLYFSTPYGICSMDLNGGDIREEYLHDVYRTGTIVYSAFVKNDMIEATLRDHEGNLNNTEVPLAESGYHVHTYKTTKIETGCETAGSVVSVCSCGFTVNISSSEPYGHNYTEMSNREATLITTGKISYVCSECEDSYEQIIPRVSIMQFVDEAELSDWVILIGVIFGIIAIIDKIAGAIKKKK